MSRFARRQSASSLYHVINRGVGKQIIFEDDADRRFFLKKLDDLLLELHGSLLAWCLMDNHFHLLVRISHEDLSTLMHRLQTSYAGYFNRVHGHTGALFGSRFKSEPVETDEYLMMLVRYIHENPVKARIAGGLRYPWSSFREYEGTPLHIDSDFVLGVFGGVEQFLAFHELEHGEIECMDYHSAKEKRISDNRALAIAEDELGKDVLMTVKGMNRETRNAALVALRRRGLSIRQIQRLTGVSLGVISRAVNA